MKGRAGKLSSGWWFVIGKLAVQLVGIAMCLVYRYDANAGIGLATLLICYMAWEAVLLVPAFLTLFGLFGKFNIASRRAHILVKVLFAALFVVLDLTLIYLSVAVTGGV